MSDEQRGSTGRTVSVRKLRTKRAAKSVTWEAWNGCVLVDTGKKRPSGKPLLVMAVNVIVCMTERDAKLVAKKYPGMKFVERTGSSFARKDSGR